MGFWHVPWGAWGRVSVDWGEGESANPGLPGKLLLIWCVCERERERTHVCVTMTLIASAVCMPVCVSDL